MIQSCPNVHILWSSHRVPIEFPFIDLGIQYQSIFYFTCARNTLTTMKRHHDKRNKSKVKYMEAMIKKVPKKN